MEDHGDWRDDAFRTYRAASLTLELIRQVEHDVVDYQVVELREAMLDLKQAVAEDDPARADRYVGEISLLLAELRRRLRGK